jgi:CO/xanthine dehydrogenase Mo-binding subunit
MSIDTSVADAMPGVKAVITGADIPKTTGVVLLGKEGRYDLRDMGDNLLAHDTALYEGHAVAAVAATSVEIARNAAERIIVHYENLPPVLTVDQALAPGATILHDSLVTKGQPLPDAPTRTNIAMRTELRRGDVDKGFTQSDIIVERQFTTPMVHQGYIEPHACVARYAEDGQILVWTSTQGQFIVRDCCAGILGVDAATIKVIPSEIGGGFGGKIPVYLEPVAIALSRKAHRPVKIVMSRDDVFRASGPTSGTKVRMKIGVKQNGTIVAASGSLYYEAGAYPGSPAGAGAMCALAAYKIPHFVIEAYDIVVNRPKVAAYRAPGSPSSTFATESVLDEIANRLEIDPIDFRLMNAMVEGDQAPYGPKYGPIGLKQVLESAKNHPHWQAPLGLNQGRGVACGFWFNAGLSSSATVALSSDGSATVVTGNPDIGGTRVAQALMVSEELGVPPDRVRPTVADTDSIGYSDLTGGSRVCYATGMAVIKAAQDVRDQLLARAAKIWDVGVDKVTWDDGCAVSLEPSTDRTSLTLRQLAEQMPHTGGPIIGRASVNAPMAGPAFAVNMCDIEVDKETGVSRVVRYTAIQDVGKAVHPSFVEGQMQGGAAQGIGWALNEEYLYSPDGVMQNAGFLDYRMPVASDLPMIDTVLIEVENPLHPYGVRGVGEVPIVPPLAAVANAMNDATGIRFTDLPLSPPRVLKALLRD